MKFKVTAASEEMPTPQTFVVENQHDDKKEIEKIAMRELKVNKLTLFTYKPIDETFDTPRDSEGSIIEDIAEAAAGFAVGEVIGSIFDGITGSSGGDWSGGGGDFSGGGASGDF